MKHGELSAVGTELERWDDVLNRAARLLFEMGRSFARRPPIPPEDVDGPAASPMAVQICLAIVAGQDARQEVTVGSVARSLGVEASTASRLVSQAIAAGFVRGSPSASDRRRLILDLTSDGLRLTFDAWDYQRRVFDTLTAAWDPTERELFARLFIRLATDVIDGTADMPGRGG